MAKRAALIAALFLAGCQTGEEQHIRTSAEAAIRQMLRDPESAQFQAVTVKWLRRDTTGVTMHVVCGQVNARNGFGGMVGYRRFIYTTAARDIPAAGAVDDNQSPSFEANWSRVCIN